MASVGETAGVAPGPQLTGASIARGAMMFSRTGARAAVLDVYDAAGRRLASLEPVMRSNGVSWSWDGLDRSGRLVRGALVFARARDGVGGTVRVACLD